MLQLTFSARYLIFQGLFKSLNNSRNTLEETTEDLSKIDIDLYSFGFIFLLPFSYKYIEWPLNQQLPA